MFPACSRPSVPPAANAVSVAKHAREVKQIGGCAKVVISLALYDRCDWSVFVT